MHFSPGASRGAFEVGFFPLAKKPEGAGWWAVSRQDGVHILNEEFVAVSPELCRPDQWPGQWVSVRDFDVCDSGRIAVLQQVFWPSTAAPDPDYAVLQVLDAEGKLVSEVDLASEIEGAYGVEFDGRNALVCGGSRLWSVDTVSGRHSRLVLEGPARAVNSYTLTFVRDGQEVWAFRDQRGDRAVLRFRPEYVAEDLESPEPREPERVRSDIHDYYRRTGSR